LTSASFEPYHPSPPPPAPPLSTITTTTNSPAPLLYTTITTTTRPGAIASGLDPSWHYVLNGIYTSVIQESVWVMAMGIKGNEATEGEGVVVLGGEEEGDL